MVEKYLEWTESLCVGHSGIDTQHKKLVAMINEYYEQLGAGDFNASKKLLTGLTEYTKSHFRYEEELMNQVKFEGSVHHKHEHATLISRVNSITERVNADTSLPTIEVANLLKAWLTSHIMRTDQELAKILREKEARLS